jgi:hypothetical protein
VSISRDLFSYRIYDVFSSLLGCVTTEGFLCRILICLICCQVLLRVPVPSNTLLLSSNTSQVNITLVVLHELAVNRCIVLHELIASFKDHSLPFFIIFDVFVLCFNLSAERERIEIMSGCCHNLYHAICFCSFVGSS